MGQESLFIKEVSMKIVKWAEVFERLKNAPEGKLYGIPRGGAVVAGMTGRAVDTWEEADVIVDDILDTGSTKAQCDKIYGKPFWALIDKQREQISEWVQFPWEINDKYK